MFCHFYLCLLTFSGEIINLFKKKHFLEIKAINKLKHSIANFVIIPSFIIVSQCNIFNIPPLQATVSITWPRALGAPTAIQMSCERDCMQ